MRSKVMALGWFGIWRVIRGCPSPLVGILFLVLMGMEGGVLVGGFSSSSSTSKQYSSCEFPAIYNFGDSNSDTGARSAAFDAVPPPNGETFFGKPSGRFCDGRLIIDFIAEKLGLPYLSAYLDSVGTSFRKGANFAMGGEYDSSVNTKKPSLVLVDDIDKERGRRGGGLLEYR